MPEVPPTLLGLDLGTSAIKAAVVDLDGRGRATHAVGSPFRQGRDALDPVSVDALFAAVRDVLAPLATWLPSVVGVGVAGLGESGGWVGADGVAEVPMLVWHDHRGRETADRLVAALGQAEIVRRTGRRARSWTTLSKIGWLADQGVRPSGRWTGAAGLVAWLLTGAVAQEPSLAATSGAYDPATGRYDDELVALAGVRVEWAPLVPAGTSVGSVSASGSASTGVPVGVPVTIAGHDHPVSVVGVGARRGMVTDSMGTGEPLLVAWDAAQPFPVVGDLLGHLTVTCWPGQPDLMLLWEHVRPGLGLQHLAELLGVPRPELERLAVDRPRRHPFDADRLVALEDGRLRVEDLAPGAHRDPGQTWADALDGFTDVTAQGEARLRALSGSDGATLLTGGGTRSRRWVQAKRERARHGLVVSDEPDSVARGAALLAGVAVGRWSADALPAASAPDAEVRT